MGRITPIPYARFERFLLHVGFTFKRQEGDHKIYWRSDLKRPVIVTVCKDLPVFIIKNNLRTLGITNEQYLSILEQL